MPTYEFACTECGNRVEVVRSFSDAPPTTCTVCGGVLRKVFSPVGIVFKGSGFYRTDSRGKPAKAETGGGDKGDKGDKKSADAPSGSKASSSDGGASASKPKAAEKSA
jgi:putative FmdB family regulatory protein